MFNYTDQFEECPPEARFNAEAHELGYEEGYRWAGDYASIRELLNVASYIAPKECNSCSYCRTAGNSAATAKSSPEQPLSCREYACEILMGKDYMDVNSLSLDPETVDEFWTSTFSDEDHPTEEEFYEGFLSGVVAWTILAQAGSEYRDV